MSNANDGGNANGNADSKVDNPTRKVTPTKPKKQCVHQHPEMVVDKRIVDELLLVCGVIGSSVAPAGTTSANATAANAGNTKSPEFVPVTDCLNWLQDLQRALRRDHDTYRPIGLLLGKWRVVSQKLLPLVMSCRYDRALVLTVCKILVILTKPMSENAKRAGRLSVDVKSGRVDERCEPFVVSFWLGAFHCIALHCIVSC